MTDKIISAGHTHQNRALREHITRILISWRRNIRYQMRKGVPHNIENGIHLAPISILCVFLFCFKRIRISGNISVRSNIMLS